MTPKTKRLYFIDAMRAWAILMMLQGHFIDGLLDPVFRDPGNPVFGIWEYFRGITAPVFFTVSGFIFTYLLIGAPQRGWENPRVAKGIKRGLQLLLIGYLLRLNLFGLIFSGEIYPSFYMVDVLHCIGLSLLAVTGLYLLTARGKNQLFPWALLGTTLLLFLFEPLYKHWPFSFLPDLLANYFTKANGSVFTIFPWLGYATIGAFISVLFSRFREHRLLYPVAIPSALIVGSALIYLSSPALGQLYQWTDLDFIRAIEANNYLFIRLGDVLIVFAVFMALRRFLTHRMILALGASTLSIYVIHYLVLYGSFTGLGLYGFFSQSLSPALAIPGALLFMSLCSHLALKYHLRQEQIKAQIAWVPTSIRSLFTEFKNSSAPLLREIGIRIRLLMRRFLRTVRS